MLDNGIGVEELSEPAGCETVLTTPFHVSKGMGFQKRVMALINGRNTFFFKERENIEAHSGWRSQRSWVQQGCEQHKSARKSAIASHL